MTDETIKLIYCGRRITSGNDLAYAFVTEDTLLANEDNINGVEFACSAFKIKAAGAPRTIAGRYTARGVLAGGRVASIVASSIQWTGGTVFSPLVTGWDAMDRAASTRAAMIKREKALAADSEFIKVTDKLRDMYFGASPGYRQAFILAVVTQMTKRK